MYLKRAREVLLRNLVSLDMCYKMVAGLGWRGELQLVLKALMSEKPSGEDKVLNNSQAQRNEEILQQHQPRKNFPSILLLFLSPAFALADPEISAI